MALYIDSADRAAVENLLATGLFAGITTNPTLLNQAGLSQNDLPEIYQWATAAGADTVYLQTLGLGTPEIITSARTLTAIGPNVIVKIPATRAGVAAVRTLADEGTRVLVTAVYHPTQALLADAAHAHSIAPYVGRMTDHGRPGIEHVLTMKAILRQSTTRILAASLRTADDVAALAASGVHDFAINPDLLDALLSDQLSEAAAAQFQAASASHLPRGTQPNE